MNTSVAVTGRTHGAVFVLVQSWWKESSMFKDLSDEVRHVTWSYILHWIGLLSITFDRFECFWKIQHTINAAYSSYFWKWLFSELEGIVYIYMNHVYLHDMEPKLLKAIYPDLKTKAILQATKKVTKASLGPYRSYVPKSWGFFRSNP